VDEENLFANRHVDDFVNDIMESYPELNVNQEEHVDNLEQEDRLGNIFDKCEKIYEMAGKLCSVFHANDENSSTNFAFEYSTINLKKRCWGKNPVEGLAQLKRRYDELESEELHPPKIISNNRSCST
jgi:hypothetical protein